MVQLIDRRLQSKNKSAVNRERFLRRYRGQIKEAVGRAIKGRSIKDMNAGENISIPRKNVSEPVFGHGQGGIWERVHPGNEEFIKGDQFDRPKQGSGGGGSQASDDGEGEDDFTFTLTKEEFLNYFFEDLELPNLVKTHLTAANEFKTVRAGFSSDGNPTNLNVIRSIRGSIGRRIALTGPLIAKLKELEAELEALQKDPADRSLEITELEEKIHILKGRILGIPYLDPVDLKYTNRVKRPNPANKAVMFCLMDVSGSMDEGKKDMAKRFFILLYLFLTKAYEKIEVVFIRHHTQAAEVSEEDFFHSRESGGTVVSSALVLMDEIIKKRYASEEWNIYGAQASDGDNWDNDSPRCREILTNDLLPACQYFAYIEITTGPEQNLWFEYEKIKAECRNFAMQKITAPSEIYPVFRELFKKQTHQAH